MILQACTACLPVLRFLHKSLQTFGTTQRGGFRRSTEGESQGRFTMAGNKPGPAKGDPRMVEAGRRGGKLVSAERGKAFFQAIGAKGGKATKEKYGPEFFAEIGRKGGESVKRERGVEFYADIGRKGGSASRAEEV